MQRADNEPTEWIWERRYAHPCRWRQDYPPLSLPQMLFDSAARNPDAAAYDFMGRRGSYAEIAREARCFAAGLIALGIRKGDRVGLFLPNVPHYLAAYYGAMAMGAVVVNFSPLYTVAELAHQVEDSGTRLLVTLDVKALLPTALKVLEASSLERLVVGSIAEVLPRVPSLLYRLFRRNERAALPVDARVTRYADAIANDGAFVAPAIDPLNDLALLQYTGGTTGTPKGAMLTHQNLTANARQVHQVDPEPEAEDRILGILPFFHVFANTCVLNRTILKGGQIVMLPRFDAGDALKAIARARITAMPGVPTMYQALLDHPAIASTDFSSLRICISGGAPLAPELKQRFEARSGAKLVEGYGLTESAGVVATNPYEGENRAGTIGVPIPATRILLLDKEDPSRPAPAGEPGELVVAGPQIMRGYWNRPEAAETAFAGEYLRTGDVATIDDDGYVRIVDRIKDMIAVGGFKVFPSEVEAVLYRHDAVKEVLVIGVPDAYRGEAPVGFVTLTAEAMNDLPVVDGGMLRDWANGRLGKHERLAAVHVRETLPKTMIGKLDRKALRMEVAAERQSAAGA